MERLLSLIMRRLVNMGINSGIKAVSNRGNKNRDQNPEDRQMNRQGPQGARGLRQTTKMMRRFTKL